jgi:hypothetical protein
MKLIEKVDFLNEILFIPLGDIHLGSKQVDTQKLYRDIETIKKENAYTFLMGDIFDVATLQSTTNPHSQAMNLNEAMKTAFDLFKPIKDKILGAISGNHEERLEKYAGFNPLESFCDSLEIPYAGYSAVIRFKLGEYKRKSGLISPLTEYIFFAHHSTGGGNTIGGKINRAEKLSFIFEGADVYLIGHNHLVGSAEREVFYLSRSGNGKARIKSKKIYYLDCGSYLKYTGSYAEMQMLPPSTTGAPKIKLNGSKKDLQILL